MKSNHILIRERARIRQALDSALASFGKKHLLTTDIIIDLVYKAGATWGDKAHLQFQKEIINKLDKTGDLERVFPILELAFECWNHFPHQDMNDQCPFELVEEMPVNPNPPPKADTKIIVGNTTMSTAEYETMLIEMEKQQGPFKEWLFTGILPAYKNYLTDIYQPKTVKKHYAVAEVLCERLLHVGFTSPLHIRPEFLYDEFPNWWQTHVMFGNYGVSTVENSVMEFIDFVEDAAGVSLDDGSVATDISLWRE